MSADYIFVKAVIRGDIRNPFSNLVFYPEGLRGQTRLKDRVVTKDAIQSVFRSMTDALRLDITANEVRVIHLLQELNITRKPLELELSAQRKLGSVPWWLKTNQPDTVLLAALKIPRATVSAIVPADGQNGINYQVYLSANGGSSLVTY